ncbi:MAG: hypothetical protein HYT03_01840 [Candidatus Harrisonbacteria bacterium]|nr:hypothetical protein [Candidatus Harrisonbacteria bacterium]
MSVRIGLVSRLDYGGPGYREGLWELATNYFIKRKTHYNVLIGGLVDFKSLYSKLEIDRRGKKGDARKEVEETFIQDIVDKLKKAIPVIPEIKLHIITSPAYDGWIGEAVARRLVETRRDIRLYRAGGDRLEIKQLGEILGAYAPKRGVWMRGDYYDTPALRVLKDELKRGTRGLGNINVVGGLGVSVFNPGDATEIKRPYFTLPALSKVDETRIVENQIGICILESTTLNAKEASWTIINFKDLVSGEWALVQAPPYSTEIQKICVEELKKRGPLTLGQLRDEININRNELKRELDNLCRKEVSFSWPKLGEDEASKRYYFDLGWFQKKLRYPALETKLQEDSFCAFGCLHAGCRHTDMRFFRDVVPQIILANKLNYFVGVGDFVEGLKHDLLLRNEVLGSAKYVFNYTKQEKLAAYLVGTAMLKVFEPRLAEVLEEAKGKPNSDQLVKLIEKALLTFVYIPGNHCEWTLPAGFDSLEIFQSDLKLYLVKGISKVLAKRKISYNNGDLLGIASRKIIRLGRGEKHILPSGLSIALLHPSMARTKTPSIRPQEMLAKVDSHVVFGANFHTAEAVNEWRFETGQRVCLQVGTIKQRSGFEDDKLKTVDFGVGLLKVRFANQRIIESEASFRALPTIDLETGNAEVLKDFDAYLKEMQ